MAIGEIGQHSHIVVLRVMVALDIGHVHVPTQLHQMVDWTACCLVTQNNGTNLKERRECATILNVQVMNHDNK